MKTFQRNALAGLFLALAATCSLAQEAVRVAYINTQRITTESAPAVAAAKRLDQEFSKRSKEIADMQKALKELGEKYDREALTMAESQRPIRQKEITEQSRDLQRKQRELQEDFNSRRNEEYQQVLDSANKVVRKVAETEKYDLVLQEVVYSNGKHDITDRVLKILNGK